MSTPESVYRPALWVRVALMTGVLLVLGITVAPMGILMLVYPIGIRVQGGREGTTVVWFMILALVLGLASIRTRSTAVFKIAVWTLLALAVLNLGGCVIIMNGLSKIT
jgi:hypothetical protein